MFDSPASPRAEVSGGAESADERGRRIEERVGQLSAHIAAATSELLSLMAEYDEHCPWAGWGQKSPAEFFAWRAGLSHKTARAQMSVARRLRELPLIAGALSRGEISYDKAAALCRIAHPETEETLVMWARNATCGQLERLVRLYRWASKQQELDGAKARRALRYLRYDFDYDGTFNLQAQLPAEDGAIVVRALEVAMEALAADARGDDSKEEEDDSPAVEESTAGNRRADALVAVAEASLASQPAAPGADRYQVIVTVDADTLTHDSGQTCEIDGDVPLAAETARRLSCDCSVVGMLLQDGVPIDVGRKRRTIPTGMRRALNARDKTCCFPGCSRRVKTHAHHVLHWIHGGRTKLRNLALLCLAHHFLVHEGGYTMTFDGKTARFFRPDGTEVLRAPPLGGLDEAELHDRTVRLGLEVDPDAMPGHYIDRMSYDDAVLIRHQLRLKALAGAAAPSGPRASGP